MAGYRDVFINGVSKGIGIIPTSVLLKISKQKLILPVYHTISDEEMPHIKHLYPVKGVKSFIKDLEFLLKHYTPINYDEFSALYRNNESPRKPSFLLSFDDGLREFHDIISPILIKKGIPAICFLNSGFVDNKALFYRYKSSLIIEKLQTHSHFKHKVQKFLVGANNIKKTYYQLSIKTGICWMK